MTSEACSAAAASCGTATMPCTTATVSANTARPEVLVMTAPLIFIVRFVPGDVIDGARHRPDTGADHGTLARAVARRGTDGRSASRTHRGPGQGAATRDEQSCYEREHE